MGSIGMCGDSTPGLQHRTTGAKNTEVSTSMKTKSVSGSGVVAGARNLTPWGRHPLPHSPTFGGVSPSGVSVAPAPPPPPPPPLQLAVPDCLPSSLPHPSLSVALFTSSQVLLVKAVESVATSRPTSLSRGRGGMRSRPSDACTWMEKRYSGFTR